MYLQYILGDRVVEELELSNLEELANAEYDARRAIGRGLVEADGYRAITLDGELIVEWRETVPSVVAKPWAGVAIADE